MHSPFWSQTVSIRIDCWLQEKCCLLRLAGQEMYNVRNASSHKGYDIAQPQPLHMPLYCERRRILTKWDYFCEKYPKIGHMEFIILRPWNNEQIHYSEIFSGALIHYEYSSLPHHTPYWFPELRIFISEVTYADFRGYGSGFWENGEHISCWKYLFHRALLPWNWITLSLPIPTTYCACVDVRKSGSQKQKQGFREVWTFKFSNMMSRSNWIM